MGVANCPDKEHEGSRSARKDQSGQLCGIKRCDRQLRKTSLEESEKKRADGIEKNLYERDDVRRN